VLQEILAEFQSITLPGTSLLSRRPHTRFLLPATIYYLAISGEYSPWPPLQFSQSSVSVVCASSHNGVQVSTHSLHAGRIDIKHWAAHRHHRPVYACMCCLWDLRLLNRTSPHPSNSSQATIPGSSPIRWSLPSFFLTSSHLYNPNTNFFISTSFSSSTCSESTPKPVANSSPGSLAIDQSSRQFSLPPRLLNCDPDRRPSWLPHWKLFPPTSVPRARPPMAMELLAKRDTMENHNLMW